MSNLRVIVVDSDEVTRRAILSHLAVLPGVDVIGDAADPATGHRLIRQNRPDLVLVEVGGMDDAGMRLAADVHAEMPRTAVFVSSPHKNPDLILKAMGAGAKEFLLRPVELHVLTKSIEKILRDPSRHEGAGARRGRLITFFSNKGGVGTTTLATNTAAGLAKEGLGPVGLVDFDLQLGNVASFLNLNPNYTVYDLVTQLDKVTPDSVDGFLAKHDSGISVLAEPKTPAEAESITPSQATRTIELFRSAYSYVVVDTPKGFDERTLEILDCSDEIFVVSELSLPALRNLKKCLDVFRDLQYSEARVRIVMNRYDPRGIIRLEDVQESLRFEAFWKFPNDFLRIMNGINTGTPVVVGAEESEIAKSLVQFCRKVAGKSAEEVVTSAKSRSGVLGRLFGKSREE
ncbi:MAG: AAA family ATPase [Candidatus Eisenbacteria bacterium]|nr:AAA family ATPase [Candidatus Eisenbacteria bacterium]